MENNFEENKKSLRNLSFFKKLKTIKNHTEESVDDISNDIIHEENQSRDSNRRKGSHFTSKTIITKITKNTKSSLRKNPKFQTHKELRFVSSNLVKNQSNQTLKFGSYKAFPTSKNLGIVELSKRFNFSDLALKKPSEPEEDNISPTKKRNNNLINRIKSKNKLMIGSFFQRKLGKTINFLKLGKNVEMDIYLEDVKKVLRKKNRNYQEIEFLSEYLKRNENIKTVIKPSSSIDGNKKLQEELVTKISKAITYEQAFQGQMIFRYGDKPDKFYIIIQGKISVLIPKEDEVLMSHNDYFYYLCLLSYYEEYELLKKCYEVNMKNVPNFPYNLELFLLNLKDKKQSVPKKLKTSLKAVVRVKLSDTELKKTSKSNNMRKIDKKGLNNKNDMATDIVTPDRKESRNSKKLTDSERQRKSSFSPFRAKDTKYSKRFSFGVAPFDSSNEVNNVDSHENIFKLRQPSLNQSNNTPIIKSESNNNIPVRSIARRHSSQISFQNNFIKNSLISRDLSKENIITEVCERKESSVNTKVIKKRNTEFDFQSTVKQLLQEYSNPNNFNKQGTNTSLAIKIPQQSNIQEIKEESMNDFTRSTNDLLKSTKLISQSQKKLSLKNRYFKIFKLYLVHILRKIIHRVSTDEYMNRLKVDPYIPITEMHPFLEDFALEKIKPQIEIINKFREARQNKNDGRRNSIKLKHINKQSSLVSNGNFEKIPFPEKSFIPGLKRKKQSFMDGIYTRQTNTWNENTFKVKVFKYVEVVTLKTVQKFGDVAFSLEKKRNGTIIATEETDLAIMTKENYGLLLKEYNDQIIKKNIISLLSSKLFTSLSTAFMKKHNIMNLFITSVMQRNTVLFNQNDEVRYYYFIKQGSVELSLNKTLYEMDLLISKLGGSIREYPLSISSSPQFKKLYFETKIRKKIFILQNSEFIGFEDMSLPEKVYITSINDLKEKLITLDWINIKIFKDSNEYNFEDYITNYIFNNRRSLNDNINIGKNKEFVDYVLPYFITQDMYGNSVFNKEIYYYINLSIFDVCVTSSTSDIFRLDKEKMKLLMNLAPVIKSNLTEYISLKKKLSLDNFINAKHSMITYLEAYKLNDSQIYCNTESNHKEADSYKHNYTEVQEISNLDNNSKIVNTDGNHSINKHNSFLSPINKKQINLKFVKNTTKLKSPLKDPKRNIFTTSQGDFNNTVSSNMSYMISTHNQLANFSIYSKIPTDEVYLSTVTLNNFKNNKIKNRLNFLQGSSKASFVDYIENLKFKHQTHKSTNQLNQITPQSPLNNNHFTSKSISNFHAKQLSSARIKRKTKICFKQEIKWDIYTKNYNTSSNTIDSKKKLVLSPTAQSNNFNVDNKKSNIRFSLTRNELSKIKKDKINELEKKGIRNLNEEDLKLIRLFKDNNINVKFFK